MKQFILISTLLGLGACRPGADVMPVTLSSKVVGTYQTNEFIDYRWLTLPASRMPNVTLWATDTNTVLLTLTQSFPKASTQTFVNVTLIRQPDQSIELRQAGRVLGSIQTSQVLNASGMATQGRLLRLSCPTIDFTGYQP